MFILSAVVAGLVVVIGVPYSITFYNNRKALANLKELQTSPFKIEVEGYIVHFKLGEHNLTCKYTFDIRTDGTYGLNELQLQGINSENGYIHLEVGQSVLPLIEQMATFEEWAKLQKFEVKWDVSFKICWDKMLTKIDNLDVIESTYEQRKGKGKNK